MLRRTSSGSDLNAYDDRTLSLTLSDIFGPLGVLCTEQLLSLWHWVQSKYEVKIWKEFSETISEYKKRLSEAIAIATLRNETAELKWRHVWRVTVHLSSREMMVCKQEVK